MTLPLRGFTPCCIKLKETWETVAIGIAGQAEWTTLTRNLAQSSRLSKASSNAGKTVFGLIGSNLGDLRRSQSEKRGFPVLTGPGDRQKNPL
jgi:hypothetical protein